jgi:hypothetical protein
VALDAIEAGTCEWTSTSSRISRHTERLREYDGKQPRPLRRLVTGDEIEEPDRRAPLMN